MLEVDAVGDGDPGVPRPLTALVGLMIDRLGFGVGNLRNREVGALAIERPHQAPLLLAGVGKDPRRRRDLVAAGDMDAGARAVERPVVVGAAQAAVDHLGERQVGAEMRAPGDLNRGLARRIAPGDDARAEEIPADRLAGHEIARQANRIPRPVIARLGGGVLLPGQAGLGTDDAHGPLHRKVVP
jgi:hypothetical protein